MVIKNVSLGMELGLHLSILEARLWRCETWFEGCKERGERLWICVGSLKGGREMKENGWE